MVKTIFTRLSLAPHGFSLFKLAICLSCRGWFLYPFGILLTLSKTSFQDEKSSFQDEKIFTAATSRQCLEMTAIELLVIANYPVLPHERKISSIGKDMHMEQMRATFPGLKGLLA